MWIWQGTAAAWLIVVLASVFFGMGRGRVRAMVKTALLLITLAMLALLCIPLASAAWPMGRTFLEIMGLS